MAFVGKGKIKSKISSLLTSQNWPFRLCLGASNMGCWKVEKSFIVWWEKNNLAKLLAWKGDPTWDVFSLAAWRGVRHHQGAFSFSGTRELQVVEGRQTGAGYVQMLQQASFMTEGPRLCASSWLFIRTLLQFTKLTGRVTVSGRMTSLFWIIPHVPLI